MQTEIELSFEKDTDMADGDMDARCTISGGETLIERLQNENSALLEELKQSQQREQKYCEVDAANSKLRRALDEALNNELDGLKIENKDLRVKLNHCHEKLHCSEQELRQLKCQEAQQEPQADPEQESKIIELQSSLDAQKERFKWLMSENKDLREELAQFKEKMPNYRNLEMANNELQSSLDAQKEQIEWLQGKNQDYEDDLKQCKKKIQNYRKLENANDELQSLLHARENRLKNLKNEIKQLHAELQQLGKSDPSRMTLEKENHQEEMELSNHKLKITNIELQCALDVREKQVESLQKESRSLHVELKLSQEKMQNILMLEKANVELMDQLAARDKQLMGLEDENKIMHSEIQHYFEQLEQSAQKLKELENLKQNPDAEMKLLRALDAQKEHVKMLKKENSSLQTELEHVHMRLDKLVHKLMTLQKQNAAINYRMSKIDGFLKDEENTELNGNDGEDGKISDVENENMHLRLEIGRLNALIVRFKRHSSESDDQLQHTSSSTCSIPDLDGECSKWCWHNVLRELVS